MTFDIVITFDTAVMRGSCLIVFIVNLLHCIRYVVVFVSIDCTIHVYSYIQVLAASVFIKFTASVSVSVTFEGRLRSLHV